MRLLDTINIHIYQHQDGKIEFVADHEVDALCIAKLAAFFTFHAARNCPAGFEKCLEAIQADSMNMKVTK